MGSFSASGAPAGPPPQTCYETSDLASCQAVTGFGGGRVGLGVVVEPSGLQAVPELAE